MTAHPHLAVTLVVVGLGAGGCGTGTGPVAVDAHGPLAPAGKGTDASLLLRTLVVAADIDPGGYDRDRFDYPAGGSDSRGCSTRARVLIRDSLDPPQISYPGCKILAGRWIDPYTGATYTSPADVSIDHVVPLKEASLGNLGSVQVSQTRLTDLWPPPFHSGATTRPRPKPVAPKAPVLNPAALSTASGP